MKAKEKRVFLETKLRNLKRNYNKVKGVDPERAIDLKCEIDFLERQLNS